MLYYQVATLLWEMERYEKELKTQSIWKFQFFITKYLFLVNINTDCTNKLI